MTSWLTNSKKKKIERHFKVLVIGDSGVGKSSIITRIKNNEFFDQNYSVPTIGIDYKTVRYMINDNPVKIGIWDCAGQDRFRSVVSSYYRNANAIVIVYDITNPRSFNSVDYWLKDVSQKCTRKGLVIAVVGNKTDVLPIDIDDNVDDKLIPYPYNDVSADVVSKEDVNDYVFTKNIDINYRVSAKNGRNVNELFEQIACKLVEKNRIEDEPEIIRIDSDFSSENECCTIN